MPTDGLSFARMAPKPVYPRSAGTHGLFGVPFVSNHFMVDDHWTPNSLMETYKGVTDVLTKHRQFYGIIKKVSKKRMMTEYSMSKRQTRNARRKLQKELRTDNITRLRNLLVNHKDMQRLYQNIPVSVVEQKINTRTFVLRKERDNLNYELKKLEAIYHNQLMMKADLENRITYQNEFMLEEELKSHQFRNKIAKSKIRLAGNKAVNAAYKKMIQVLCHDEIYYEPILRSLKKDYEDLSNFIKYILYLGHPAIKEFNALSSAYRTLEANVRKDKTTSSQLKFKRDTQSVNAENSEEKQRYIRKTPSMTTLDIQLNVIASVIKEIKTATLCSQAREIFPRIKKQKEGNDKLEKIIENSRVQHSSLDAKQRRSELMEILLINNRTEEETKRLETIRKLKKDIAAEGAIEAKTLQHLKNRGDVYLILRFTLWNLCEILRFVNIRSTVAKYEAQTSYLNLPLIKYEMLAMRSVPPLPFQTNVDKLFTEVKYKVEKLMKRYRGLGVVQSDYMDAYAKALSKTMPAEISGSVGDAAKKASEQALSDKTAQKILDNSAIKELSRKLVEENLKKEDN